jgi:hypothetical protein
MFLRGIGILKRTASQASTFKQGLSKMLPAAMNERIFSKPEVKSKVSRESIILTLLCPRTNVGSSKANAFSPPKREVVNSKLSFFNKTPASSIAEVVIALTIIALCFTVASLIFIRSINVSTRFQEIRKQTEIQSKIMESLYRDNDSIPLIEMEDITVKTVQDKANEKLNVIEFLGTDNRVIWKQQVLKTSGN